MSSLIEQAAERLEQLRKAGVDLSQLEPSGQSVATVDAGPPPTRPPAPQSRSAPTTMPGKLDEPGSASRRVEIDLARMAAVGIVAPNAPRTQLADQYRVLKRPLISNALGRGAASIEHANLIMVTSALAGEGKSFTSINLAMSIAAELDHTVMLVDADEIGRAHV